MTSFTPQARMSVRVVFDNNIWVSALRWLGAPFACALLAFSLAVQSVTCEALLMELRRVLLSKFRMSVRDVDDYINRIQLCSLVVPITGQLQVVTDDPNDDKVLECAVVGMLITLSQVTVTFW